MQRLGVVDRAAEHVRDLLSRAERVDPEYVRNAPAYRVGAVTIVLDPSGEVVQTVLREEVSAE
jgi:hypothetical protein